MTKILYSLWLSALALWPSWCLGENRSNTQPDPQMKAIKIGWSGPLTGNSAVLGIDSAAAAQMAVAECNEAGGIAGHKVELLIEDDSYDTAKAVSAYNKLVSGDHVKAVLLSTYGGVFAVSNRAVADQVVVLDPLDCNNDIAALSENTFCLATESESIGEIIAHDIAGEKSSPVGIISDETNPFMVLVENACLRRLKDLGQSVQYRQTYNRDTPDFKSLLLQAKQRNLKALVLLGHDQMGQAMKEARGLGISAQFYTVGTITSPGFQKLAGEAANGARVAYWQAPSSPAYQAFIERFAKKAGRPPLLELATIPTYDSAKVLLEALRQAMTAKGEVDIAKVKEYLYSLRDYAGVSGRLTMDQDGAVRSIKEDIYTFNRGKLSR